MVGNFFYRDRIGACSIIRFITLDKSFRGPKAKTNMIRQLLSMRNFPLFFSLCSFNFSFFLIHPRCYFIYLFFSYINFEIDLISPSNSLFCGSCHSIRLHLSIKIGAEQGKKKAHEC